MDKDVNKKQDKEGWELESHPFFLNDKIAEILGLEQLEITEEPQYIGEFGF